MKKTRTQLYYHKTDGGAEYLSDTFIEWAHNGRNGKEGTFTPETKYIVRIDGDMTRDAFLITTEDTEQTEKATA